MPSIRSDVAPRVTGNSSYSGGSAGVRKTNYLRLAFELATGAAILPLAVTLGVAEFLRNEISSHLAKK